MNYIKQYAELFELLCSKFDGADLGKKVTQKMFYFFERKGIPLNLRYGIHFYGPYSEKLDNALHILESKGYVEIDTSGKTHKISLGCNTPGEVLGQQEKVLAESVLDSFAHKSPLELEALATMDYVANSILGPNACDSDIINKFKEIKGTKFPEEMTKNSLDELKRLAYIS